MSKKDLDTLIDEALGNIRNDRKVAREFLNEVANEIVRDPGQNKYLSLSQPNTLRLCSAQTNSLLK